MAKAIRIALKAPASEMAQEEIRKQIVFIDRQITNVCFLDGGTTLQFERSENLNDQTIDRVGALVTTIQHSVRNLERKIAYRSPTAGKSTFHSVNDQDGVNVLGTGIAAFTGLPLQLFRYFNRVFESLETLWDAEPVITPTLIDARVLAKCDYFRSFPHYVTYACHIEEDPSIIQSFRERHESRDSLDENTLKDMHTPEMCLSPAVCYHLYYLNRNQTIPKGRLAYGGSGKCFRYESSNLTDLRRLWDFTMREIVFLGDKDTVLKERSRAIERVSQFLEEHEVAAEIRTASDPFFISPDAPAKTFFQLSSETKFEIAAELPQNERIAIGSFNYHGDFFGKAFDILVEDSGPMHSVCIAFGLERWVHAFLTQHGADPKHWPLCMRRAPEFRVTGN